jgi:microcystin-dependent protein
MIYDAVEQEVSKITVYRPTVNCQPQSSDYDDETTAKIGDAQVTAAKLEASLVWPTGMIVEYGGESVPTGWLECNGTAVPRTGTYAALFAAIDILWGAGNGSTTFNIPDLRGYFTRGWDHGAGNDPDKATRTGGDHVGSSQADAVKAHTHTISGQRAATGTSGGYGFNLGGPTSFSAGTTGGNETRGKNKNTMCIIKY